MCQCNHVQERTAEVWDAIIKGDAQKLAGLAVERAVDDLYIAEVEYIMYKCGHGEIHAKGGKYHPLCPKCDDAMVDGVLDEDGRYQKWLRQKNESKTSTLL